MAAGHRRFKGSWVRGSGHRKVTARPLELLEDRRLLAYEPVGLSPAEIAPPQPYLAAPIDDVFSRHAVTVEDMIARAGYYPYQPDELVVAYTARPSVPSWSERLSDADVTVLQDLMSATSRDGVGVQLVQLDLGAGSDLFQAMRDLSDDADILWSAPNFTQFADPRELTPNDPQYAQQYHHPLMQNNVAWDVTLGDPSIIIGITDDGFELSHVDLQQNIWVNSGEVPANGVDDDGNGFIDDLNGWDFITGNNNPNPNSSSNSHGTHVAGIAAARTNNGIGVAGTAGQSTIMPLQFYDLSLGWNAVEINQAFRYGADNGAKIVTTSYNIDGWVGDPTFTAGLQYSYDHGVLHFNSAGNNSSANPPRQAFEQTLLVVSTESSDTISGFSNYGTGVDICAPGGSIRSTLLNNSYGLNSGTSMASPNAAGVAALIWSAHPTWTRDQVAAQLLATADNIDGINPGFAGQLGAGRANSGRAVTEVAAPPRVKTLNGIPEGSAGLGAVINSFQVGYSTVMDGASVTNVANYDLRNAGTDGVFDTADDQVYAVTIPNPYRVSTNLLQVHITGGLQSVGDYRLRIISGGVADAFQTALDGNSDGVAGDHFERFFSIDINDFVRSNAPGSLVSVSAGNESGLASAADADLYSVYAEANEQLAVIVTPQSPTVTLSVQLVGQSGVYTAPAPGAPVVLPATPLSTTGDVSVRITGSGASNYTFDIYRNADISALVDGGIPVDLDDTRIALGSGRYAAIGQGNGSTGGLVLNQYSNPALFVDISATGTPLNLTDDSEATIVTTVGNALFPAGNVTVSNNGAIVAGAGIDVSYSNTALPSAALGNSLLPFWDDLDAETGNVYWRQQQVNGVDALIVQWHNRPHFNNVGSVTFQLQLFASGPVAARYVYQDVDFGNASFNFGASATIGAQQNATTAFQHSYNSPVLANGDVIDASFGSPTIDSDEYQLDLTGRVGSSLDVIVESLGSLSLSGQTLELLDSTNTVVASSTTGAANYDLGIQGYVVASGGLHTVRLSSNLPTRYSVLVTEGLVFDTETNNAVGPALRRLDDADGALGYLAGVADRDIYRVDMAAGQMLTFQTGTPLDDSAQNPLNSLDPSLTILSGSGTTLASDSNSLDGKNARLDFTAGSAGTFYVAVNREAGTGEYTLKVTSQSTPDGDFNNDGFYDCADINSLVNAVANGGSVALFDLTGDGLLTLADVDAWRVEAGGINLGAGRVYRVGDANLDGVVDASDFNAWNANKFTSLAAWCDGDFNADGVIDAGDFNLWNSNKFTSSDGGRTLNWAGIAPQVPAGRFLNAETLAAQSLLERSLKASKEAHALPRGAAWLPADLAGNTPSYSAGTRFHPDSDRIRRDRHGDAVDALFAEESLI